MYTDGLRGSHDGLQCRRSFGCHLAKSHLDGIPKDDPCFDPSINASEMTVTMASISYSAQDIHRHLRLMTCLQNQISGKTADVTANRTAIRTYYNTSKNIRFKPASEAVSGLKSAGAYMVYKKTSSKDINPACRQECTPKSPLSQRHLRVTTLVTGVLSLSRPKPLC